MFHTMVIKCFYVDYINQVDIYLQDFSDQITYTLTAELNWPTGLQRRSDFASDYYIWSDCL